MLSREAGERQQTLDRRDEAGQPVRVVPSGPPGRQGERPSVGCILVERQISARAVRVRDVASQDGAQVRFTRDEGVIQALALGAVTSPMNRAVNLDETL